MMLPVLLNYNRVILNHYWYAYILRLYVKHSKLEILAPALTHNTVVLKKRVKKQ